MEREAKKAAVQAINSGKPTHAEQIQDSIQREASKEYGILCFSAAHDQETMWDVYADGYRGFVIEFNCIHAGFQQLGKLWKVEYSDEPPIYDPVRPSGEYWRFKHTRWQRETEYRIIRQLRHGRDEPQKDGQVIYFFDLPRVCVKAVYLGHRMDKTIRNRILLTLEGTSASKYEAISSREHYSVSFQEITC
jgi:hypothetical protein